MASGVTLKTAPSILHDIELFCTSYHPEEKKQLESIEKLAATLYQNGQDDTDKLKAMSEKELLSQASEIPHETSYRLIKALSEDPIQTCDKLKYLLSRASRVFLELTLFQCAQIDRRLYPKPREEALERLKKVSKTIPHNQLATYFELKCCKEALKSLEIGRGKWKEVAYDHSLDLLEGFICTLLSVKPTPSAASATFMVGPLIRLAVRVHHEWGENWHRDVWALRWSLVRISTLKDYKQLLERQNQITNITKHKQGPKLALALGDIFADMIFKVDSTEFKTHLLLEFLPILDLSDDGFWRARYRALEQMIPLYDHLNAQQDLSDQQKQKLFESVAAGLVRCLAREKANLHIMALVRNIAEEFKKKNSQTLQGAARTIDLKKAETERSSWLSDWGRKIGLALQKRKKELGIPTGELQSETGSVQKKESLILSVDQDISKILSWQPPKLQSESSHKQDPSKITEVKNAVKGISQDWDVVKETSKQQADNLAFIQKLLDNAS